MALVISTEAHANIISVAPSRALQMAGVADYVSAVDVPGTNLFGAIERTEEIFATEEVRFNILHFETAVPMGGRRFLSPCTTQIKFYFALIFISTYI